MTSSIYSVSDDDNEVKLQHYEGKYNLPENVIVPQKILKLQLLTYYFNDKITVIRYSDNINPNKLQYK